MLIEAEAGHVMRDTAVRFWWEKLHGTSSHPVNHCPLPVSFSAPKPNSSPPAFVIFAKGVEMML